MALVRALAADDAPEKEAKPASRAGREKQDRIVRKAMQLFLDRGYDLVSINDIINAVGGSKATIYSHFGNKVGLLKAVIETICADVTIGIDIDAEGSVEDQLRRIATSFLTGVLTERGLKVHRMMATIGRRHPEGGRMFYEFGPAEAYSIIAQWMTRQQAAGIIDPDADPLSLAVRFHDMILGDLQMSWLTGRRETITKGDIEKRVNDAVPWFLAGCTTRSRK